MARILIVDDERKIRLQIAALLGDEGHTVDQAEKVEQALNMVESGMFDLIITDVRLPDRSGIELLKEARIIQPTIAVVVITAYGSVEDAVEAMRLGAYDYLQKPFQLEALRVVVENALSVVTLKAEHQYLLNESRIVRGGTEFVGSSAATERIHELIQAAASKPSTVLITGESGTGKELVAEALHNLSGHRNRPLVRINCPAIPENLFESELFGHIKGAFTGAVDSHQGKFELANNGTVFLDGISEIPFTLQPKLLRVLEERSFTRVGGNKEILVNLRIIAATNQDLETAIKDGRFRSDLYYRLNVFPIHIPPLRQRSEDIPGLAHHLLERIGFQYHLHCQGITNEAMQCLEKYQWPGNVRELRNVLERGMLLAAGEVLGLEHLPSELTADFVNNDAPCNCLQGLNKRVEAYRKECIRMALEQCNWRKKDAAHVLGLSPRALSHYISKYDIDSQKQ